jgi:hypothetical protein
MAIPRTATAERQHIDMRCFSLETLPSGKTQASA